MCTKAPFTALVLAGCVTLSCAEDGLTGVAGHLVGAWRPTRAEFISQADTTQRMELVAQGLVMRLAFNSNGRYTMDFTEPGGAPQSEPGNWRVELGDLLLRPDIDPDTEVRFAVVLGTGSTLTLMTLDAERDLNGDGIDDPARLVMELVRAP